MKSKLNAWLAFAAVSVFWGTTFLAIRIGVKTFPPFLMAAFRHSLGGILICIYFLWRGYKLPGRTSLKVYAVNGLLMLVVGNGLVTWAEKYVSSGLTALVCSLTPIWIVFFNSLGGTKEKISWQTILGLGICLAGQFIIFSDNFKEFANPDYTLGIVFIVIANIGWAIGTIYSKNHKTDDHPLFGAGLQMITAGIVLTVAGTVKGEWSGLNPDTESILAVIYLAIFGSIVAFGAYMYALKALPATIVSTYTYINTIIAVALGWLWLDEAINNIMWLAVALTIAGLYLVNNSFQKKQADT